MRHLKLFVLGCFILPFCSQIVSAQEVSYKIIENTPYTHKLNVGIVPLDFLIIGSAPLIGSAVSAQFRPIPRVIVEANASSALFMKDNREDIEVSGLKKTGGLNLRAGGAFVWRRTGRNWVTERGGTTTVSGRFTLKGETRGTTSVETYILFPYNRMVERSIRAGGYFFDFPTADGASQSSGVYAGVGKLSNTSATLDITGFGEKHRSTSFGYHLDLLFGATQDHDGTSEAGIGVMFGFDMLYVGGLFPLTTSLDLGALPGQGSYVGLRFAGNILMGKDKYSGDYTYAHKSKRKMRALIQSL
jgi:hypothetical protein